MKKPESIFTVGYKCVLLVIVSSLCCISLLACTKYIDDSLLKSVPSYFEDELNSAYKEIERDNIGNNGFIYFTDTHVNTNRKNSFPIVSWILQKTTLDKVVWGGDAATAYGNNLNEQVSIHKKWFDTFSSDGSLFLVKGNHDFAIREDSKSTRVTEFSLQETSSFFADNTFNDVVRNNADPTGCYYYYDDVQNKVRYLIIDTNDIYTSTSYGFSADFGIGTLQLDWLRNVALESTPSDYKVVIISHVPITDTTGPRWKSYSDLYSVICDAKANGINVVLYVSGHIHHDIQTYQNGIIHVVTASDAYYQDYIHDPFAVDVVRNKRSVNEQCIDCFLLGDDLIKAVRIGVGGNRSFHTVPIRVKRGESVTLHSVLTNVTWYSYNSSGNSYSDDAWNLNNDYLSVGDGIVKAESVGESVVLCQDKEGNREIWNVIVE